MKGLNTLQADPGGSQARAGEACGGGGAQGARVWPNKFGLLRLPERGYGRDLGGRWWLRPEAANARTVHPHDVLEHRDGTITVSGYLHNGEWRGT